MEAVFRPERFFFANNYWYVYMRPGDEHHQTYSSLGTVAFQEVDGRVIAGPFKKKDSLMQWLRGFITLYGQHRKGNEQYTADNLVLQV